MRAMILAAGRGARMGALTQETPKPLLRIADRYLIEYSILSLTKIGVKDIVINVSYQREKIIAAIGGGARYGVKIQYSEEPEALETGGGILQALPMLGNEPFIVLSSDVITDYPLQNLPTDPEKLAHLVLVDNPLYHPEGDFGLVENTISMQASPTFTFGNVGVYRPELFADCKPGYFRLGDLLKKAISEQKISGEHYQGLWHNLGSPEDLQKINTASR